jgi:hypothetical protein
VNIPAASDGEPVAVMSDDELAEVLGKSKRSVARMRKRGQLPGCFYQLVTRNVYRAVTPRKEAHDAIASLHRAELPEKRLEDLAVGRGHATDLRRERRDLAFLGKRVLVELGADELAAILKPIHTGPLRDLRTGHGPLIRITLQSALRHAGVRDTH